MFNKNNNGIFYLVIALVAVLGIGAGVVAYTGQNNGTVIESQVVQGDYVSSPEVEEPSFGAVTGPDVYFDMFMHQDLTVDGTFSPGYFPTIDGATTTLTVAMSGTTFLLGGATDPVFTLPATTTAAGVYYRFVVSEAITTDNLIVTSDGGDNIEGTLIVAGAVVDCASEDTITFVADGENIGDYVEVYNDGIQWLIGDSGVLTASKLTCTAT